MSPTASIASTPFLPRLLTFLLTPDCKLHSDFCLIVLSYYRNVALMNSQIYTIHIAAPLY